MARNMQNNEFIFKGLSSHFKDNFKKLSLNLLKLQNHFKKVVQLRYFSTLKLHFKVKDAFLLYAPEHKVIGYFF